VGELGVWGREVGGEWDGEGMGMGRPSLLVA